MKETPADYDNHWKEAIDEYFEQFLSLCFPEAHAVVDWSRQPQLLDKELQQIAQEAKIGKRLADKLFQVWQKNGKETRILIHVEIQNQKDDDFDERMYIYNYRCYDKYHKPVISLAVLGDEVASWHPSAFRYAIGGCEVSLKFPSIKLLDYAKEWENLEASTNPFAIMIMAHLKTQATSGKPQERKEWKWNLMRRLFERGYDREDIIKLFRLIDWMMVLPKELQQQFRTEIKTYQEERKMPLLSRIELMAMEEGIEQGIQQGSLLGSLQTARESVIEILEVRFTEIPTELREVINKIEDLALLKSFIRQSIAIPSLAEFQQLLPENIKDSSNS